MSDRVQETTTTTGTGTITLEGADPGCQPFISAISDGQKIDYLIFRGSEWELGSGIFTASNNTLTRDHIYSSSIIISGTAILTLSGTYSVLAVTDSLSSVEATSYGYGL